VADPAGAGWIPGPDELDEDVAAWAVAPEADDDGAAHGRTRGLGERARQKLLRRRRRSWILIGGVVGVVVVVLAVVLIVHTNSQTAVIPNGLVTTFQPGELKQVPNACDVVSSGIVQQYLPGKVDEASPLPVNGQYGSGCNWTVDQAPTYRLLELNLLAYSPNGLASGDGSATYAAMDAYSDQLQSMQHPSKKSYAPKATVTFPAGLGNQAFSAIQVFKVSGAPTDVATVIVRYHNVIVSATMSGPAATEHTKKGVYDPANESQLSAAALAFAQAAVAALHSGQVQ
jgi:hypothetical protein